MSAILVAVLRDKKKDHLTMLTKSTGLIKELIDKNLHSLLHNKTIAEIWTILRDRFYHISPMSISYIFVDICNIRLSEYRNVIDYTS